LFSSFLRVLLFKFIVPLMRCLGLDYGEKRWGLSHGDELGLALPLPAAVEPTAEQRFAHLAREIAARRVTDLVVGYPYNLDGTAGPQAAKVDAFIAQLERRFQLPVHRSDERLTSYQAETAGRGSRRPARTVAAHRAARATGEVDSRAAALILQDFLDARLGPPPEPPPAD
jgi:putative Holliday junction resolvase